MGEVWIVWQGYDTIDTVHTTRERAEAAGGCGPYEAKAWAPDWYEGTTGYGYISRHDLDPEPESVEQPPVDPEVRG